MNKFLLILSFSVFLLSCNENETIKEKKTEPTSKQNVVQVIDFHSTHRCETCLTIEKKTRETLSNQFKKELDNGTITFETLNIDKKENEAIVEEYLAYGTSLFITVVKDGKSDKTDLTDFAFTNAMADDGLFEDGLTEQLNEALKKL